MEPDDVSPCTILLGCIGIHKQSVFDLGVVQSPGCSVAIGVVNGNTNMVAISTTYSSVEVTLFLFHQEPSACCNAKKEGCGYCTSKGYFATLYPRQTFNWGCFFLKKV
jgi:hypothetical protein